MSLRDILIDELRDLYSAENQLVKALPKIAKAAEDEELAASLSAHVEETKNQVMRLKQVFEILGTKPTGKHCSGMEGLVEEGQEATEEDAEGELYDIGLICACARVEHYEKAGYTVSIEIATALGHDDVASLLQETLAEEDAAAENLLNKFKELVQTAVQAEDADEEEEDEKPKSAKDKTSEKKSKDDEKEAGINKTDGLKSPAKKAPAKKK